jgi:hypothetical protein
LLKYNEFSDENVWRKADGPNWEKAFYTEKMAKIPHLLYKEEYKNKLEDVCYFINLLKNFQCIYHFFIQNQEKKIRTWLLQYSY